MFHQAIHVTTFHRMLFFKGTYMYQGLYSYQYNDTWQSTELYASFQLQMANKGLAST